MPTQRTRPSLRVLLGVAVVAAALLAQPYLGLDAADSRIPVRSGTQYAVLVVHVLTAAVALVLGAVQLLPGVRARRRAHRLLGRVYLLAGVGPAAATAVPVALWSGHLLTQVGLTTAAVLWLATGALALRAARRHDVPAHRAWVVRNYALTLLAVTARVLVPLLVVGRIVLLGADPASVAAQVPELIGVGQVLAAVLDLAVAEVLLRRTRAPRPPVPPAPASATASPSASG